MFELFRKRLIMAPEAVVILKRLANLNLITPQGTREPAVLHQVTLRAPVRVAYVIGKDLFVEVGMHDAGSQ